MSPRERPVGVDIEALRDNGNGKGSSVGDFDPGKMGIEYVDPGSLRSARYNPRQISDRALKRLARLLDEHGFVDPVIARGEDGLVIAGHQRIKANELRRRPDKLIPCIFLEGLSDSRAKLLNIALNNPGAQGEYDEIKLAELLGELDGLELDLPAMTGFSSGELAELASGLTEHSVETPELLGEAAMDIAEVEADVVVIFEMPRKTYAAVKSRLDDLIAAHDDLTCHLRFAGKPEVAR